jgi:ribosomal protein S18 acetylase RimI-like enzyme
MEIRRLGQSDGALLEIAVRTVVSAGDDAGAVGSLAHLARALADPHCYFLVCLNGLDPVAYLSAFRFPAVQSDGLAAYLYEIDVLAEHRRHGIATKLIAKLKEACRVDGVDTIWVGTSLENPAARRTFEATGAERVSDTYVEYTYDLDERPRRH